MGTVTFESLPRFAALDLRYDPSLPFLLASSVLAMLGLFASLFVPRRRLWVRLTPTGEGGTLLSAAALARGEDPRLAADLERVTAAAGSPADDHRAPGHNGPGGAARAGALTVPIEAAGAADHAASAAAEQAAPAALDEAGTTAGEGR
jgi:cytochrome c biogenesis protein